MSDAVASAESATEVQAPLHRAGLTHAIFDNPDALAGERRAWDALVDRFCDGNPFLAIDWHLLWLAHFGAPDALPRYVRIANGSRAVGYFPLLLQRTRFHGMAARR